MWLPLFKSHPRHLHKNVTPSYFQISISIHTTLPLHKAFMESNMATITICNQCKFFVQPCYMHLMGLVMDIITTLIAHSARGSGVLAEPLLISSIWISYSDNNCHSIRIISALEGPHLFYLNLSYGTDCMQRNDHVTWLIKSISKLRQTMCLSRLRLGSFPWVSRSARNTKQARIKQWKIVVQSWVRTHDPRIRKRTFYSLNHGISY